VKPAQELALAYVQIARHSADLVVIDPPRRDRNKRVRAAALGRGYEPRDHLGRREIAVQVKPGVDLGDVDPQVPQLVKRHAERRAARAREEPDPDHQIAGRTVDELRGRVRPNECRPLTVLPHDIGASIRYNAQLARRPGHEHPETRNNAANGGGNSR
jgi:hypothetical protein